MELNNTLSLIAQGLLIIALPIVIAAAVQHFRVMTQQLKSKLNEKAAEQVGGLEGLIGPEKKKQALQIAQSFLAERGINLDVTKLVNLIEAEVQTQFAKPAPVADSAQARQALVDSAIQAAVQAAEQSGLTGLIQNLGPEKKAYALQLAGQYLGQYGIAIDPQLLSGLVESQVLHSTMQAQAAAAQVAPAPAAYPSVSPTTGLQPGG
jgi:hypothetical protein